MSVGIRLKNQLAATGLFRQVAMIAVATTFTGLWSANAEEVLAPIPCAKVKGSVTIDGGLRESFWAQTGIQQIQGRIFRLGETDTDVVLAVHILALTNEIPLPDLELGFLREAPGVITTYALRSLGETLVWTTDSSVRLSSEVGGLVKKSSQKTLLSTQRDAALATTRMGAFLTVEARLSRVMMLSDWDRPTSRWWVSCRLRSGVQMTAVSSWIPVTFSPVAMTPAAPGIDSLVDDGSPMPIELYQALLRQSVDRLSGEDQFHLAIEHAKFWEAFKRIVHGPLTTLEAFKQFIETRGRLVEGLRTTPEGQFVKIEKFKLDRLLTESNPEAKLQEVMAVWRTRLNPLMGEGELPYGRVWELVKNSRTKQEFVSSIPPSWFSLKNPGWISQGPNRSEVGEDRQWWFPPPTLEQLLAMSQEEYAEFQRAPVVRKGKFSRPILATPLDLSKAMAGGAGYEELMEMVAQAKARGQAFDHLDFSWRDEAAPLYGRALMPDEFLAMGPQRYEKYLAEVVAGYAKQYQDNGRVPPASLLRLTLAGGRPAVLGLGISVKGARDPEGHAALEVTGVMSDTVAAQGGIKVGDVLLALENQRLDSPAALRVVVDRYQVGSRVKVSLLRGGKPLALWLSL